MAAMRLPELLRAIYVVAQTGAPPAHCEALARRVFAFADMVGWATGPIDEEGQLLDRLAALQADLELKYAQNNNDTAIAALHDALTDLARAIVSHDDDLRPNDAQDDDEFI